MKAGNLAKILETSEIAQQLKNAVIKLENSISKEHREEIIKAKERFFIDSDPWFGKRIQNQNVDIISILNKWMEGIIVNEKIVSLEGFKTVSIPYFGNNIYYLRSFAPFY